jgi:hypothetical protein
MLMDELHSRYRYGPFRVSEFLHGNFCGICVLYIVPLFWAGLNLGFIRHIAAD